MGRSDLSEWQHSASLGMAGGQLILFFFLEGSCLPELPGHRKGLKEKHGKEGDHGKMGVLQLVQRAGRRGWGRVSERKGSSSRGQGTGWSLRTAPLGVCLGDGHKSCMASASRGRPGPSHQSALPGGKTGHSRSGAGDAPLGWEPQTEPRGQLQNPPAWGREGSRVLA